MQKPLIAAILFALFLSTNFAARAGELIISNTSQATITCKVDGYTIATGWPFDWQIQISPGVPFHVGPSYQRSDPVINWVHCGTLETRQMNITPSGPDGTVVLNGQQQRVLNVALYPYLPSNPNGNFATMVLHAANSYQAQYPEVLVNVVLNQNLDIYSYSGLSTLLGAGGFDLMELDMLYMSYVAQSNLAVPVTTSLDNFQPQGVQAVTVGGTVYAVPSWLCMDFTFAYDQNIKNVTSLSELLSFLAGQPATRTQLVGDFDGSWRLPAIYINAYVAEYGYANITKALQMPPDQTVIDNLVSFVSTCTYDSANKCIDGTYHQGPDGVTEKAFATAYASSDVGFSEQSFYVKLYEPNPESLYAILTPWGPQPTPLLYTDAFVTSAPNCANDPCTTDAANFAALMTGDAMKLYETFSADLPVGAPPRRLLVATKSFYQQAQVSSDPLYSQYEPVFTAGNPFPNTITEAQKTAIGQQVCAALQQKLPGYDCTPPATKRRVETRR